MPRIIVTTNSVGQGSSPAQLAQTPVLLDEHIESIHLGSEHAAKALIERLTWAVSDAEHAEHRV